MMRQSNNSDKRGMVIAVAILLAVSGLCYQYFWRAPNEKLGAQEKRVTQLQEQLSTMQQTVEADDATLKATSLASEARPIAYLRARATAAAAATGATAAVQGSGPREISVDASGPLPSLVRFIDVLRGDMKLLESGQIRGGAPVVVMRDPELNRRNQLVWSLTADLTMLKNARNRSRRD